MVTFQPAHRPELIANADNLVTAKSRVRGGPGGAADLGHRNEAVAPALQPAAGDFLIAADKRQVGAHRLGIGPCR